MIGIVNGYIQDLLYGRRAEVDIEDAVVGACTSPGTNKNQEGLSSCGVHKAVVSGHSNEKPCRSRCGLAEAMFFRCGPCQVRMFYEGPLCSRSL